jgi:hypothetical protein
VAHDAQRDAHQRPDAAHAAWRDMERVGRDAAVCAVRVDLQQMRSREADEGKVGLMTDLAALSAAASAAPWEVERHSTGAHIHAEKRGYNGPAHITGPVTGADAALIVALRNGYADGSLVERDHHNRDDCALCIQADKDAVDALVEAVGTIAALAGSSVFYDGTPDEDKPRQVAGRLDVAQRVARAALAAMGASNE